MEAVVFTVVILALFGALAALIRTDSREIEDSYLSHEAGGYW